VKIFDAAALSYRSSVIKIAAGIGLAAAITLFRVFVRLPESAGRAVGAVCVILIILLLIIAAAGAAEAAFVRINRSKKRIKSGEADWPALDTALKNVFELMEVSDIMEIDFTYRGAAHSLSAISESGAGAGYAYAKTYALDGEIYDSLDALVSGAAAREPGLGDPDEVVRVIAVNGMDPGEYLAR